MEKKSYEGFWWIPNSEKQFYGTLTINRGDFSKLNIFSNSDISDELKDNKYNFFKVNKLYGLCNDGTKITLSELYITNYNEKGIFSISDNAVVSFKMIVENVYLGFHFEDSIKTKKIHVSLPHLSSWMNKLKLSVNGFGDDKNKISLDFSRYENVIKVEDIQIKFGQYFKQTQSHGEEKYYSLNSFSLIELSSDKEIELSRFLDITINIVNLISICIDRKAYIQKFEIIEEHEKFEVIKHNKYFKHIDSIAILPFQIPIQYSLIENDLEKILLNWTKKSKELEWIFNVYFSYKNNPNIYINDKFLAVVRNFEVYYNKIIKNTYQSEEEYEKTKKILIDSIPQELEKSHKDSLKSKIKFGNEKSLKNKLSYIYDMKKEYAQKIDLNKQIIRKIVDTRNHFTHYLDDNYNILTLEELVTITKKLELIVEILILDLIGFTDEELDIFTDYHIIHNDV